jgi:branched-chain amino acid transport system permease protein
MSSQLILNPRQRVAVAAIIVAAVILPFFVDPKGYFIRIAAVVLVFAAAAQAWNIVGGLANQMSLGHAAFFGIGAYTSTLLYLHFGVSPWIGMLVGASLAGAVSALLSIPLFRLRGHYFALATLAFTEVLRVIANIWVGVTGGPVGLTIPFKGTDVANFQFETFAGYYWVMLGLLIFCSLVFYRFSTGAMGYRLRAIRENEVAAEVVGVDTFRLKLSASVVSAMLTGLCGTAFVQFTYFFDPDSVFHIVTISVRIAMIVIIGGMGTLVGPILGALFLIPLEELVIVNLSEYGAGLAQLIFGLVIIAAMLIEPKGLIAMWRRITNRMFGRNTS